MKSFLYLLLLFSLSLNSKVLVITHSYNRPDFIELHAFLFKAFLQDDYEYVVFNDAPQQNMKQQIEHMCEKLGIRCFRVRQHLHNRAENSAGSRHMDCIQYSLDKVGYDFDGIVAFVDSDMFLIKPFSIEKYLKGYDLAGDLEGRANEHITVRHLSPALAFMDMRTLPNKRTISFEGGIVEGLNCDVGAHTYYYFKNNPHIHSKFFGHFHIGAVRFEANCKKCDTLSCASCLIKLHQLHLDAAAIKFIHNLPEDKNVEFFLNGHFLHYRGGSNWDQKSSDYHQRKTQALNTLIADITK